MEVLRDYKETPVRFRGAVLAIGNFDGVHRGHQSVLGLALSEAQKAGRPAGVMAFEPHPRQFFERDRVLFRLTPLDLKLKLFAALGLDFTVVLNFDAELARLDADTFVREVLADGLGVAHVITGHDFKFGQGRGGSSETLAALGSQLGFTASAVAAVGDGGEVYSSSRVRAHLRQGEPEAAADVLGYWWRLSGTVTGGDKRGHGLGYPTANLAVEPGMALAHGIYAARVRWRDQRYGAAAYLGTRPTFAGTEPFVEAFLFDFDGDLYGEEIEIEVVAYLRGDENFASPDALKSQIAKDCEAARTALAKIAASDPMAAFPLGRSLGAGPAEV